MTSSMFSAEEIFNRFYTILKDLKIHLSPTDHIRRQELRSLFPSLVSQLVHSDYATLMDNYILDESNGDIPIRFGDYYALNNEAEYLCALWYIKRYAEHRFLPDTYFVMYRTLKSIHVEIIDEKIAFTIETHEDKYPLRIRYSKPQVFLIERWFREMGATTTALTADFSLHPQAVNSIVSKNFYVLKYFHKMRPTGQSSRPSFWTFHTLSTDVETVIKEFHDSVDGGFLHSYQPEKFVRLKTELHRPASAARYRMKAKGGYLHVIHCQYCAVVFFKPTGRSKYTAPILAYIDAEGYIHWNGFVREKEKIVEILRAA